MVGAAQLRVVGGAGRRGGVHGGAHVLRTADQGYRRDQLVGGGFGRSLPVGSLSHGKGRGG